MEYQAVLCSIRGYYGLLGVLWTIMDYQGVLGSIKDYGLLESIWSILDYSGLLGGIRDYQGVLGLLRTIWMYQDYYGLLGTIKGVLRVITGVLGSKGLLGNYYGVLRVFGVYGVLDGTKYYLRTIRDQQGLKLFIPNTKYKGIRYFGLEIRDYKGQGQGLGSPKGLGYKGLWCIRGIRD